MKSLMALCTGVMTLVAASSLFVSCYDDSALKNDINKLDKRLQVVEQLKADLDALTAKVNGLYTLQFDVTSEGKVQYSFDGKTWTTTDIVLAEGCACPAVSLVDNGETVTVKIGDAELVLEKPQEIVFELRAGKVYFLSETTSTVAIKSSGIEDVSVMSAPKGWFADINSEGVVEITAPEYSTTQSDGAYDPELDEWVETPAINAATGFVKVHACSTEGKCMVGKIAVEVAEKALVVKAFTGTATFTMISDSRWGNSFYYGVSTKDAYEAEIKTLADAIANMNWDALEAYGYSDGETVELSIAEALGTELEVGTDYVAWALVDGYEVSVSDAVLSFYTHYSIEATEVEEERTANNITVNVTAEGLDTYVAVAMPAMYCDDPDYTKEMMVETLANGQYYGKLHTEAYSGDLLEIAEGTNYYMGGNYSPECVCYLFILPLDGRPVVDYSAADVLMYEYQTSGLTAGGSVNVSAEEVTEYDGMGYDDDWNLVSKHFVLNPYSELGVQVSFSSEDWGSFYYQFMDAETYAATEGNDEVLVSLLLEGYGYTQNDLYEFQSWPVITESFVPGSSVYFVAFAVDTNAKYGQVTKVELATDELEWADLMWEDGSYATNLVDGVLKNNTVFEFTPQFTEDVLSYKYLWANVTHFNQYEGMDDATMAENLFLDASVETVAADELVDGKILVGDNAFSNDYFFAIIPITAEGPGCSALMLNYSCKFAIDEVATEGAEFEATEPGIVINMPTKFQYDNYDGEDPFYGFAPGNSFNPSKQYYYQLDYNITPVEGTEVCTVLVINGDYELPESPAERASALWAEKLGSYYTVVTTEAMKADYRFISHYDGTPAPDLYLCVSWKDAEGNYYYKEYSLQDALAALDAKCNTPAGKQWAFTWMQMGGLPTVLDFGVTLDGQCVVAYDPVVMGAPEGSPYQIYNMVAYEFVPVDETSGKLILTTVNMFDEEISQEFEYSNYTGNSCHFEFDETSFVGEPVDGTLTEVVVDMTGGVM